MLPMLIGSWKSVVVQCGVGTALEVLLLFPMMVRRCVRVVIAAPLLLQLGIWVPLTPKTFLSNFQ